MPQVTLMGHPLHPQLIVMPAGLVPFSLGGHLVYHHGMRVRGTDLPGSSQDVKFPQDHRIAQALASTANDQA